LRRESPLKEKQRDPVLTKIPAHHKEIPTHSVMSEISHRKEKERKKDGGGLTAQVCRRNSLGGARGLGSAIDAKKSTCRAGKQ